MAQLNEVFPHITDIEPCSH